MFRFTCGTLHYALNWNEAVEEKLTMCSDLGTSWHYHQQSITGVADHDNHGPSDSPTVSHKYSQVLMSHKSQNAA